MAGHASSHFDASIIAPSCKNTQHVYVPAGGVSIDQTSRGCGSSTNYNHVGCQKQNVNGVGGAAEANVCVCNTNLCNDGSQSVESAGVRESSLSHVIITIPIAMSAIAARLM